jgi:TDG/mug DNA glycosylase family protein
MSKTGRGHHADCDPPHVLPDLLAPGLAVVFCGTAPGTVSATLKQYYAHPQNKFWRVLYDVGLTPSLLKPSQYADLLGLGIGLTDIAKQSFGMDNQLPRGSLGAEAVGSLRVRMDKLRPSVLAFTSLTGGRKFLGARTEFGLQPTKIGPTAIWVLPSPSPAAHWNWDDTPWRALAGHVRSIA